jgi:hypothetical protein
LLPAEDVGGVAARRRTSRRAGSRERTDLGDVRRRRCRA